MYHSPKIWFMKPFLCTVLFLFCALFACAQETEDNTPSTAEVEITHLLSLDFMLLAKELSSGGIGFGIQYEQQIFPHHAVKGYFGHATINTGYENYYCVTVSFGLFAEWYPLSKQLRRLYVGVGSYFDYLGYITESEKIEEASGEILSVISQLGYKFSLPQHFLLDVFCGYKYPYQTEVKAYGRASDYLKSGFQYGISLKRVLSQ